RARPVPGADDPPTLPRDLPHDGALRPEAREAPGAPLPRRGHRGGPLRDVGRGLPGAGDAARGGRLRGQRRGARRHLLPHDAAPRPNGAVPRSGTARRLLDGEHLWLERGLAPAEELERFAASAEKAEKARTTA